MAATAAGGSGGGAAAAVRKQRHKPAACRVASSTTSTAVRFKDIAKELGSRRERSRKTREAVGGPEGLAGMQNVVPKCQRVLQLLHKRGLHTRRGEPMRVLWMLSCHAAVALCQGR